MSGGIFTSQNKVRAGFYINFKSIPKPMTTVGTRGKATIAIPLSWGDTLTELYSTDLTDGSSLKKVGLDVTDEGALILRKMLSHTYKAYIYRLDTGGVKATATVGEKTFTAKYAGTFGNKIQIVIVDNEDDTYTVETLVSGVKKDSQKVAQASDLVNNDFVDFGTEGTLTETAGTALTGGTDGTVAATAYTSYFAEMGRHKFDTMGLPYATEAATLDAAKLFITQQNELYGRKCKLVVKNSMTDSDYVINSINGYVTTTETVSPEVFVAEVTGLDAGAEINQSLTYRVIADPEIAVSIIGQIDDKDIEQALNSGKFILSKRDDGAIIIEKDINSYHTFVPTKNYAFSKNRVKRTLDEIANTGKLKWATTYCGKVDNNDSGRNIYKGDFINYLNTLQDSYSAIQNFNSGEDIEVLTGNDVDSVVCNLSIQPVDSMEKIYMSVRVDA